jgi:hypothetical protein
VVTGTRGKWDPKNQKGEIECAANAGHFTDCGVISNTFIVEDQDKLDIQCSGTSVSYKLFNYYKYYYNF